MADAQKFTYAEGDTELILDILPPDLAETAFEKLREEVKWDIMNHRGSPVPRLVAVEGEVGEDGSYPIYRHPADESPPLSPFSPTVAVIRARVEEILKHPVNHVLIQHYRTGADYISEHSDKTIDIVRGTKIVNVSIGAQRTMTLRTKKDAMRASLAESRTTQQVPLPHNSMFVLGLESNKRWLHSIRTDKRPPTTKSPAEVFNNQERISLTFRNIGTFLSADHTLIWGQGATEKSKDAAHRAVREENEASRLIRAFGDENHNSDFDWDAVYGEGFDVVHFKVE